MTVPRIDLIGQNGGDGAHYKYEEVTEKLWTLVEGYIYDEWKRNFIINEITKILVENFSDA